MAIPAIKESMLRKPILMPPRMVDKVGKIARKRNVSFAKVVRDAVDVFDSDVSSEDEALLDALAETMIKTTQEVVEKIDAVEKRLDETHALLAVQ